MFHCRHTLPAYARMHMVVHNMQEYKGMGVWTYEHMDERMDAWVGWCVVGWLAGWMD